MNIEDRKYKNRNPFVAPEGYFQDFHDNLMKSLPHAQKTEVKPRTRSIGAAISKRWSYAAAIAVLFISTIAIYNVAEQNTANNDMASNMDYVIDDLMDNYPIDDYTFYCYLTNNDIDY